MIRGSNIAINCATSAVERSALSISRIALWIALALLIHRNYRNERRMWRKAAIRFMILVARPIRGSIEERHTHHGRRYSPAVRSSIGCMQEIERWFRRRAALVGCGRASAARRREEAPA